MRGEFLCLLGTRELLGYIRQHRQLPGNWLESYFQKFLLPGSGSRFSIFLFHASSKFIDPAFVPFALMARPRANREMVLAIAGHWLFLIKNDLISGLPRDER